jgi:hypothetical protein
MASIPRERAIVLFALTPRQRMRSGFAALGALAIVGLSFVLVPDARGHGTHEQLGLPPCTTFRLFGFPCPFCGMTTAFVLMAHAHPIHAFQTQPAGALAFPLAIVFAGFHLGEAGLGRSIELAQRPSVRRILWRAGIGVVGLAWIYKMVIAF